MSMLVFGADGSGVKQRKEKESKVIINNITNEDISDGCLFNIATQYSTKNIAVYINALTGLRDSEIALFKGLGENFEKACIIIDRLESVSAEDIESIKESIYKKLGLSEEYVYLVKKSETISDVIKDKGPLNFKKLNEIAHPAAKNVDLNKPALIEIEDKKIEPIKEEELEEMLFIPTIAVMGIFMSVISAFHYISSAPLKKSETGKNLFGIIFSLIKYLSVFAGTAALAFVFKKYSQKGTNE